MLRIYYGSLLQCQHMFYWTGQAACRGQRLHLLTKRPAVRTAQLFNSSGSRLSCKGVSSHHLSWKETVWSGSLLALKDSVFLGLGVMLCDRLKGQLSKNIPMPARAEDYRAQSSQRYLSWTYGSLQVLREYPLHSYLITGSHPFFSPTPNQKTRRLCDE